MNLKGYVDFIAQTDVGQVRDHNEDYLKCVEPLGVAVLADGMGGMNAGEVASSMSVHLMVDELVGYREGTSELVGELSDDTVDMPTDLRIVKHVIEKANSAVFHVSQTQPQCRGMGTTVVVSLFYDNKIFVGHIGDSRMYRFRDNRLEQITKDHSFVQELIDRGVYTKEEARESTKKNVVTRALGVAPTVEVEVHEHKARPGDIYLMCSDGLTDLVADKDIETTFRELGKNLSETAGHLVNLANASGGKDNISVVLARVNKPYPANGGVFRRIINWFE
ncbi:MAG: Stp1/IreP family PP2C-type Ser/Thr phosphatase [Pseudomonadales bacterium]|nr:Stp1/IreP family PP2C-type Ser/Thr phosphatase [Pseudomonadales bacterium]